MMIRTMKKRGKRTGRSYVYSLFLVGIALIILSQNSLVACPEIVIVTSGPTDLKQGCSAEYCALAGGGTAPYTYQWTGSAGGSGTGECITATAAELGAQWVQVVVTDANGCTAQKRIDITVHEEYEILSSSTNIYTAGPFEYTTYTYYPLTPTCTDSVCISFSTQVSVGISGGVEFLEGHFGVTMGQSVQKCHTPGVIGTPVPCGERGRLKFGSEYEETTGTLRKWSCDIYNPYTDDNFNIKELRGVSYVGQDNDPYCGPHSSQTQSCSCNEGYGDCNSPCTGGDFDGCEVKLPEDYWGCYDDTTRAKYHCSCVGGSFYWEVIETDPCPEGEVCKTDEEGKNAYCDEVPEFPAGVTAVFGATLFIFLMMRRKYVER